MTRGKITYLDGFRLHRALTAGIRRVMARQQYLNRINVFPVPDGDTGTNLSFTLKSILDNTHHRVQLHAGRTAVAIADAALDGARGNSGVILAQFLQGFSDSCAEIKRMTVQHFTRACEVGYEYAHQALSEPVEGTILSVIRASTESMKERTKAGVSDFLQLLKDTVVRAEEALRRTPEQLEILKKRGVVDAGAAGFVYILSGISEFIHRGSIRSHEDQMEVMPSIEIPEPAAMESVTDSDLRYCTECLVTGGDIPRNKLREALMELGNSLVLGGSKERIKIHIHTDEPQAVFDTAKNYGEVTGQKADDMHRQTAAAATERKGIAVVTDSTADLPAEIIEEYDIHLIPIRLNFGDKGYLDKVSITPVEFFKELTTNPNHPQTSQPTPGDFWRTYQFLSSHYESIISIHIPLAVSGTIQSAENAARRLPDANITILDATNTTVGLGLIVAAVAKAVKDGHSHDEVLAIARKAIEQTVIHAAIADLSYAVRGGRISGSRKVIADLLRVAPVLGWTDEGKVDMAGVFFGRKKLARGLAKWLCKRIDLDTTYDILISHSDCLEDAQILVDQLARRGCKSNELHITDTGTAIGSHAGPGSLIVALQPVNLV